MMLDVELIVLMLLVQGFLVTKMSLETVFDGLRCRTCAVYQREHHVMLLLSLCQVTGALDWTSDMKRVRVTMAHTWWWWLSH